MKKNILRVLSLVIVAAMLFAFASCTQKVEIRLVDKDGNDMTFPAAAANNTPANNTPSNNDTPAPSSETPAPSSEQPSSETPSSETPSSEQPASDTPASDTPASSETPSSETPASTLPSTKEEICNFYAKAVNDIKNNGSAGYSKKEFQTMGELNVTGIGAVDNAIKGVAGNYFKGEDQVETQVSAKGSDDAKKRMLGWNLTDNSKVVSASLNQNGGKYDITIVMADEDTPHKGGGSHLDQVGSVLLWEDIDAELQNVKVLNSYENVHVKYTNYTINATISPDGKISSIKHHTDVRIEIGQAKILFATLKDKVVGLENTVNFSDFAY